MKGWWALARGALHQRREGWAGAVLPGGLMRTHVDQLCPPAFHLLPFALSAWSLSLWCRSRSFSPSLCLPRSRSLSWSSPLGLSGFLSALLPSLLAFPSGARSLCDVRGLSLSLSASSLLFLSLSLSWLLSLCLCLSDSGSQSLSGRSLFKWCESL